MPCDPVDPQHWTYRVGGQVCWVQGHLGHGSRGVLTRQGVVRGTASIKLCSV